MSKLAFDYSKWDNIEISDDEADTHPNIDKASWFRMKHRSRVEREETEKMERVAKCFASYGLPIHVPPGLDEELMFKKIGLDKKNKGNSIRCTIVTDIGVSIPDPQPCEKELIAQIVTDSTAAGANLPEWQPHEGNHDKTSSGQAGGFMGGKGKKKK